MTTCLLGERRGDVARSTGRASPSASRAGPWRSSRRSPRRISRSTPASCSQQRSRGSARRRTSRRRARAEVQVADDEGGQGRRVTCAAVPPGAPLTVCSSPTSHVCWPVRCATLTLAISVPTSSRSSGRGPATTRGTGARPSSRGRRPTTSGSTATSGRWCSICATPTAKRSRASSRARGRAGRDLPAGHDDHARPRSRRLREAHPRVVTCRSARSAPARPRARCPATTCCAGDGRPHVITGAPDGRPLKTGTALVDMLCGLYADIGTSRRCVRGPLRDGAARRGLAADSALAGLLNLGSGYLNAGVVPGRMGNDHPSIVPYGTYQAADGPFALAVGSDGLFARLCRELGRPELADDERFATNTARLAHRAQLGAELEDAFATATAEDWVARLRAAGVPAGLVNDVAQAFALRRVARPRARRRDGRRAHRPLADAPGPHAGARRSPPAAPGRARRRAPRLATRAAPAPSPARPAPRRAPSRPPGGR